MEIIVAALLVVAVIALFEAAAIRFGTDSRDRNFDERAPHQPEVLR